MRYIKYMLTVLAVCFCLSFMMVPARPAYASGAQTAEETAAEEDEETFFFIMMGGALLIIITAVVTAVSMVSSSIAVAANMDVDGE